MFTQDQMLQTQGQAMVPQNWQEQRSLSVLQGGTGRRKAALKRSGFHGNALSANKNPGYGPQGQNPCSITHGWLTFSSTRQCFDVAPATHCLLHQRTLPQSDLPGLPAQPECSSLLAHESEVIGHPLHLHGDLRVKDLLGLVVWRDVLQEPPPEGRAIAGCGNLHVGAPITGQQCRRYGSLRDKRRVLKASRHLHAASVQACHTFPFDEGKQLRPASPRPRPQVTVPKGTGLPPAANLTHAETTHASTSTSLLPICMVPCNSCCLQDVRWQ